MFCLPVALRDWWNPQKKLVGLISKNVLIIKFLINRIPLNICHGILPDFVESTGYNLSKY
jgi:hypothetical protein